jgi:hypothetical protein
MGRGEWSLITFLHLMDINRLRTKTIYSITNMAEPLQFPEKGTDNEDGADKINRSNDYPGTLRFTPVDHKENPVAGGKQIELFLPMGFIIGDKVQLENQNQGILRGAIGDKMSGRGNSLTDQTYGTTFTDYLMVAAATAAAKVAPALSGVAQEITRTAPNPNTRSYFKQVGLRQFQFQFKMIPTSQSEARTIRAIIKAFRAEMYPETIPGAGDYAIGYRIPHKYKIESFYGDQELGIKLLPCFLESVQTNYNSSGMSFLRDPAGGDVHFSEVDLALNFQEGRALNKKLVEEAGF